MNATAAVPLAPAVLALASRLMQALTDLGRAAELAYPEDGAEPAVLHWMALLDELATAVELAEQIGKAALAAGAGDAGAAPEA